MKLLELNIKEYGNLKNRRICPGEGLTLIEEPTNRERA